MSGVIGQGDWSPEAAEAFIERAKRMFPGSYEESERTRGPSERTRSHKGTGANEGTVKRDGATVAEEALGPPLKARSNKGTKGTYQGDLSPVGRKQRLVADASFVAGGPLVRSEGGRLRWQALHVLALGRYFGADDDGRFPCPLPGDWHGGSAWIDTADEDHAREPRLFCCGGRWRSLGEVRAALAYGTDSLRSNIELATWTRRLAHDIGAFVPLPVALPELPPAAHDAVRKAREGFALLVGLRWADGEHRPVAWSVRFAAAWCGLTHWAAAMATRVLIEAGVIVEVGRAAGRVRLYLPGEGTA